MCERPVVLCKSFAKVTRDHSHVDVFTAYGRQLTAKDVGSMNMSLNSQCVPKA